MRSRNFLLSISLPGLVSSAASPIPVYACKDLTFVVSATATNMVAANPPADPSNVTQVIAFLTQPRKQQPQPTMGTYKLYGQYCVPFGSPKEALQLLVHGNTYDHTYFSAFQDSPSNNPNGYADYSLSQRYATLAIDRLGTGASDHPDPVNVVQEPFHTEILHNLVQQLRGPASQQNPLSGQSKIVWVGHSYGSILGTQLSAKYPNDIDAFIQTGLAIPLPNESASNGQLACEFVQAGSYDPTEFPPSTYIPGYVVSSSKQGREEAYYAQPSDFSATIYSSDFQDQKSMTLGEALTQTLGNSTAYSNPVLVYTGQQDAMFCGNGTRAIGEPDCGPGGSQIAAVKSIYPAVPVNNFESFAQPNAGHCSHMHYTARESFVKVSDFLEKHGL